MLIVFYLYPWFNYIVSIYNHCSILYKYVHLTLNKLVNNWTSSCLLQDYSSYVFEQLWPITWCHQRHDRNQRTSLKRIGTLLISKDDPDLPFICLPTEIKENAVHLLFSTRKWRGQVYTQGGVLQKLRPLFKEWKWTRAPTKPKRNHL